MNVLSALFGSGVRFRNALYERKVLGAKHLAGPVVSVGNLSVGGSGKTPFVLLLGSMLKARGVKFDILSRGYGRKSKGVAVIDPAGSAAEFGDEPLLMARRHEEDKKLTQEEISEHLRKFRERTKSPTEQKKDRGY